MSLQQKRIPFAPIQESGQEELAGGAPVAWNVVMDDKGCVRRRPCITAYSEAPTAAVDADGIAGLHATTDGDLYAVGNSPVFKKLYSVGGGSATEISSNNGDRLHGNLRPTFAETEMLVVIAAGIEPHKIERATNTPSRLGGSPPRASHVIANNSRLLMNDIDSQRTWVYYSGTATGRITFAGFEQWSGAGNSGVFTANARPDPLVAIAENTNEVFALGSTTVQTYGPDGQFIYSPSYVREYGCGAPYSIVRDDNTIAWLDDKRRIVASDGRSFKVLSGAIAKTLTDLTTVSDCFGYRVHTGYVDALAFTFPTEGRTFVYQKNAGWSQWGSWDDSIANWAPFPVNAHTLVFGEDVNVVGLSDGRIGKLSLGSQTDFGDSVVASVTSGFLSRGTSNRKYCRSVRFTMRRGFTSGTGEPKVLLQWRDNLGAWGNPVEVSLGAAGDYEVVVTLRSLGVYRSREWKVTFSGPEDLALVDVTEEFDILDS
jgi:hypothetical protein